MDNKNIKFTVVTCTYNAAQVLQTTLDSVRRQTWRNVEHIIMDGRSADSTVVRTRQRALRRHEQVAETCHGRLRGVP